MTVEVSDARSNKDEQIGHAAEELARSRLRKQVFEAIYHGKRQVKKRSEIESATGLNNKQVLDAGRALVGNGLVTQEKVDGEVAYRKDAFYKEHKNRILQLANNPEQLAQQPRNSARRGTSGKEVVFRVAATPAFKPPVRVTIDDIDSFSAVRAIGGSQPRRLQIAEITVKQGFQAVIGETAEFKDWGGEVNDLSSSRVRVGGKRRPTAIAFKGSGTTGKLTPKKMGANGDQIQRLVLHSEAEDVFLIQYVGEISDSVVTQLAGLALARAAETGRQIYYGVIDGQDTSRLIKAYPTEFNGG